MTVEQRIAELDREEARTRAIIAALEHRKRMEEKAPVRACEGSVSVCRWHAYETVSSCAREREPPYGLAFDCGA